MESRMRFNLLGLVGSGCKLLLLGFAITFSFLANAETDTLWKTVQSTAFETQARFFDSPADLASKSPNHSFENAHIMSLNDGLMRDLLNLDSSGIDSSDIENNNPTLAAYKASAKSLLSLNEYEISLPLPDGRVLDLTLVKESILPAQLAAKYPQIHTYKVLPNALVFGGKVDYSPNGLHAMLQMFDGEIVFIDPVEIGNKQYAIYHKSAQKSESNRTHSCGINDNAYADNRFDKDMFLSSSMLAAREIHSKANFAARAEDTVKNYSIAIATTGEYSAKFGGSVSATMAAITTSLNRVNQVLERDLGIRLNLVEDNDLLINTDASSDPYPTDKLLDLVSQNQTFIDSVIGNANYDIGHLFTTKGGGLAAIASVCNPQHKAKGVSGITSPYGDSFDMDFVAHEIGHQLGATHTFNSTQGACSTSTRTAKSAFEPGSGSSIMSYAGHCGLDNIQPHTDAMFHIGSIKQINEYTTNGYGNRCGVARSSQNTPPTVNAGSDFSIPARTPFALKGTASDTDGDTLIYAWEQLDAGEDSTVSSDKGNNALFRVHLPNESNSRTFPPLENIIKNQIAKGEALPYLQRNLTMSFVAQDGFNAAVSDEMQVNVIRTGSRFALNYPRTFYTQGNTYPIFWNLANTDKAPINCSSVNVLLSVDGGEHFEFPLATNVPNTGETSITIPVDATMSSKGRFKIECSDNIFFAISARDFFVTESDDSVSIVFGKEDQPETHLKDVSLSSTEVVNQPTENTSPTENTATASPILQSGGGRFDLLLGMFFLFLVRRFLS